MIVENSKTAMYSWTRNVVSSIILAASMILLYMTPWFKEPIWGIHRNSIAILLGAIYLFLILRPLVLNHYFIYATVEEGVLRVKFYKLGFIPGKPKTFEIPVKEYNKFEIRTYLYGLREDIILFRKIKKGIAKYPPLSLTALTRKQRNQFISMLKSI